MSLPADILAYIVKPYADDTIMATFRNCCKYGDLAGAQWLVGYFNLTVGDTR